MLEAYDISASSMSIISRVVSRHRLSPTGARLATLDEAASRAWATAARRTAEAATGEESNGELMHDGATTPGAAEACRSARLVTRLRGDLMPTIDASTDDKLCHFAASEEKSTPRRGAPTPGDGDGRRFKIVIGATFRTCRTPAADSRRHAMRASTSIYAKDCGIMALLIDAPAFRF